MPSKRSGTHRVTAFLSDAEYQSLNCYVANNYSASDAYGARSEVVSNAVMSFCSSPSIIVNHLDEDDIKRIIETHKETLDKLAENDELGDEKKDV
jgi:hypothetical protein